MSDRNILSVVVILSVVLLTGESAYAQQDSRRIGIGVAIGDAALIVATAALRTREDRAGAPEVLVPIQLTNRLRLEPEIGFFHDSHREPFDNHLTAFVVGVGVLPQILQQNFRLYYGIRVGYLRTREEEVHEVFRGGTETETQTVDGFFVAPTVGGEHLFSNRFSLGGEVQVRHTSVKGDHEGDSIKTSVATARALVITRFYF